MSIVSKNKVQLPLCPTTAQRHVWRNSKHSKPQIHVPAASLFGERIRCIIWIFVWLVPKAVLNVIEEYQGLSVE